MENNIIQVQGMTPEAMAEMMRVIVRDEMKVFIRELTKADKPKKEKITPVEAASVAGKSIGTIRNRVKDGTLKKYPTIGNRYELSRKEVEDLFCRVGLNCAR